MLLFFVTWIQSQVHQMLEEVCEYSPATKLTLSMEFTTVKRSIGGFQDVPSSKSFWWATPLTSEKNEFVSWDDYFQSMEVS